MRRTISQHDVAAWADSFMSSLSDVGSAHGKAVRPAERT